MPQPDEFMTVAEVKLTKPPRHDAIYRLSMPASPPAGVRGDNANAPSPVTVRPHPSVPRTTRWLVPARSRRQSTGSVPESGDSGTPAKESPQCRHCDGARCGVSQGQSDSALVRQHHIPKRLTDSSGRASPSRITLSACHHREQPRLHHLRLRANTASRGPRGPSFLVTCQPPTWRSRAVPAADHPRP
jgi:hypothetical protein